MTFLAGVLVGFVGYWWICRRDRKGARILDQACDELHDACKGNGGQYKGNGKDSTEE